MHEFIWGYWLKVALRAGVPFSTFWELTPAKLMPFVEVANEKKKEDAQLMDQHAYMVGAYVLSAMGAVFGKHSKPYPKEPMFFKDEEKEEMSEEEKTRIAVQRFEAFTAVFNQKFN